MRHVLFRSILAALLLMAVASLPTSARDRDPLAPVFSMEAHQFEAFPPDIVAEENQSAIAALVDEARLFGVPVAVRVVELPTDQPALGGFNDLDPNMKVPDETMSEMARAWMSREPIESSPGAADGFLMLVVMPQDPTLSNAVIETGPNALPLNGLTRQNIDEVLSSQVLPHFERNEVSQGIRTGMSVFSYNNLFGEPERLPLDGLHRDLRNFAATPFALLTTLSALGLIGLAAWVHRRPDRDTAEHGTRLSPFAAAALRRGQVDDAVVTGSVMHLVRLGAVVPGSPDATPLRVTTHVPVDDPVAGNVLDELRRHAGTDGVLPPAAMRRLHDLMRPVRTTLQDDLARRGYFNAHARVEHAWLLLASLLVGTIALLTLLPSILSMSGFGVLAIIIAATCIVAVLIWAHQRPWTTDAGQSALDAWLADASTEERAIFDTVVNQEAIMTATGGPTAPDSVRLVRGLRGLGAG